MSRYHIDMKIWKVRIQDYKNSGLPFGNDVPPCSEELLEYTKKLSQSEIKIILKQNGMTVKYLVSHSNFFSYLYI